MTSMFLGLRRAGLSSPLYLPCRQCWQHTARLRLFPGRLAHTAYTAPSKARPPLWFSRWTQSFPPVSSRFAQYWLLGSAASVAGIVLFGGFTRLTESGLSITEWKPITGTLPPFTAAEWEAEFAKYRATPEYGQTNRGMTEAEFRRIFYVEWAHRTWGRLIGLTFVVPAVWLVARRRVSAPVAARLLGIFALIGVQGAIGWWMVRSGLDAGQLRDRASPPRVSHYRLAVHLAAAFTCCAWMLATALSIRRDRRLLTPTVETADHIWRAMALQTVPVTRFRRAVVALTVLVFTTVMSGAFVAGLDAGMIYNEFPWMGNGLTPPASELWSQTYSRRKDQVDLWWRNLLENPSTVQLGHRILAVSSLCSVLALAVYARRVRSLGVKLPSAVRTHVSAIVAVALGQVTLGICTLIWLVPLPLAVAHQAGSLTLFSLLVALAHRLRVPPSTLAHAQKLLTATPATRKPLRA